MQVFLNTERLVLRRFTGDDLDNLFELDSDPEVMRFLTGGKPTPRAVIENETLPRILRDYERFAGFGLWAAVEKSTGEFVGWFEFRPPEGAGPEGVELGYRLRRSAWGKGYATEGSRALIRKGFTELGVRRVRAETMVINLASRRVMEKAGLTLARTFHGEWPDPITGAEHGEVEYTLTKADWERQVSGCRYDPLSGYTHRMRMFSLLFAFIALVMLAMFCIYLIRGPVDPLIAIGLFVSFLACLAPALLLLKPFEDRDQLRRRREKAREERERRRGPMG